MGNLELILLSFGLLLYTPVTAAALANLLFWTSHKRPVPATLRSVTVLIPARNEEKTLRECVNSALAQGNSVSEILVYNDHSTDGTQQVLDEIIAANPGRVRQIAAHDLPADWAGKPHACHRLSDTVNSRWMLFVDADSQLMPGAVDLLLANAEQRSATMLSAWPRIEMKSFSERLFMPLLNFVVFSLFPAPIARVRRTPSLGLAHGVCILSESETYRRLGGHSLVKNELFEDTSLARAWRAAGENSQVIDGHNIVTVRMYTNFVGIWNGFSKNYYPAFGSFASFAAFQLAHGHLIGAPAAGIDCAGRRRSTTGVLASRSICQPAASSSDSAGFPPPGVVGTASSIPGDRHDCSWYLVMVACRTWTRRFVEGETIRRI